MGTSKNVAKPRVQKANEIQPQNYMSPDSPPPTQHTNNASNGYIRRNSEKAENNISKFYYGKTIFITGGTGFLGKALIEKLLRSCTGVDTIYMLVRPKKGVAGDQRLKELFNSTVFDRIREKKPELFSKIKVINGDVTHPNLGINDEDYKLITSTVNIVFHSAATVRFNENLKEAVNFNTRGTKKVVDLCKKIQNLASFVHVSTAYSNADKIEVQEVVYPPPYDPESILYCVDNLPADILTILEEKVLGKHPNTYTLTKALAESIVAESFSDIPCGIVRPSIVTGAWKEPFPGWVDNVNGITGIVMEIGRGTISSIICKDNQIVDIIPVDIVVNTLIAAGWQIGINKGTTIPVYNCTSGNINGVSWYNFGRMVEKYSIEYPSKYVTLYPGFKFRTNRMVHYVCHMLKHMLPSFVLDAVLLATRRKPIMTRICKKIAQAAKNGEFFALNEWNFATNNLELLSKKVSEATDGKEFFSDMGKLTEFEWDAYTKNFVLGIRQYVLRDDISSLKDARVKLRRMYWIQKMVQFASMYLVFINVVR